MQWPDRRSKLAELADGLGSLVIAGDSNVEYFVGCRCPGSAIVSSGPGDSAVLLVPALEYNRAAEVAPKWIEVRPVLRRRSEAVDLPGLLVATVPEAASSMVKGRVGVDESFLGKGLADELARRIPDRSDVGERIWAMRSIKDEYEVAAIREALGITEVAIARTVEAIAPGVSDFELAAIFEAEARRRGAERFAFDTIVAIGRNSSNPHAEPVGFVAEPGDSITVDVGAVKRGYCSDMTRTVQLGVRQDLVEALDGAVSAAIDAVGPGVPASEPDRVAREVLVKHGLSRYFTHGLGHGVGLDVHEPPFLSPGEGRALEPGMVVTIEPGVYIPGSRGARIEEMVLVTNGGVEPLNSVPRILR